MKKRNIFLTGTAALVLVLAGCSNPYTGDANKGSITIALGGTSRALVNPDTELSGLRHEITLQGPGGTITRTVTGEGSLTVEVVPGNWTIQVRARGPKPAFYNDVETDNDFPKDSAGHILRALGETSVTVTAGANAAAEITMISATEVSNWEQMKTTVQYANKVVDAAGELSYSEQEEIIVLTADMSFGDSSGGEGGSVIFPSGGEKKIITLMADKPVTITRAVGGISFFVINDGTLTLGRPGMTGTISFDGARGGNDDSSTPSFTGGSIIDVMSEENGEPSLVMNSGITLTNNYNSTNTSSMGRGGAVNVIAGSFMMKGGTISNNYAEGGTGGGVYILNGKFTMDGGIIQGNSAGVSGTSGAGGNGGGVYIRRDNNFTDQDVYFVKTGGIIYGNNAGTDANTAQGAGKGAAVFYSYNEMDESAGVESNYELYRESTLTANDHIATNELAGWDNYNTGRITIALGGTIPETELQSFRYEVTLQESQGETITRLVTGGSSFTFEAVPQGNWTVKIRARGPRPAFYTGLPTDSSFPTDTDGNILRALGETETAVTVTAGGSFSETEITMIPATEVDTWTTLETAVNYANSVESGGDPANPREEIIVLYQDIGYAAGSGTILLDNDAGKNITLIADEPVRITRAMNGGSFFQVNDGTLTLGRPGMTGTISFDGARGNDSLADYYGDALITLVADGGEPSLVMNESVTLTNNYNGNGEGGLGGAVNVIGGTFTMNGGTISNNFAFGDGGGVYIANGNFILNGGTISGNTASGYAMGRGGGVYIDTGKFDMKGGTISGNKASAVTQIGEGGGVYIQIATSTPPEDAYFIKTGGVIYGAETGADANIAEEINNVPGRGAAVYYGYFNGSGSSLYCIRETTLNETDNLSTNQADVGWANWDPVQ